MPRRPQLGLARSRFTPLALNPRFFYDLSTGVTAPGGTITGVEDQSTNNLDLVVSGTASQRPALRSPAFELGARRAGAFTNGTKSQYLAHALASSSALLHKPNTTWSLRFAVGSSGTVFILDNVFDGRLSAPGVMLEYNGVSTAQRLILSVFKGTGDLYLINNYTLPAGSVKRHTVYTLTVRMNATTFDLWLDQTRLATAVPYNGTPSSADPPYALRFGTNANTTASNPASAWLGSFVAYAAALTDAQVVQVIAWMGARWPQLTWTASTARANAPMFTGTKRILFLGDSQTSGTGSEATDGFILPVMTILNAYGDVTWQAIGPNAGTNPGIAHDGNPGWTIRGNMPVAGLFGHGPNATPTHANKIETVLANYDPDVIVPLIGFNNYVARNPVDVFENDNAGDFLALLRYCRSVRPNARYVVPDEIWNQNLAYVPDMQGFNNVRRGAVDIFEAEGAIVDRCSFATLIGTDSQWYATGGADPYHLGVNGNEEVVAPVVAASIRRVANLAA